jgi:hypothetical protein
MASLWASLAAATTAATSAVVEQAAAAGAAAQAAAAPLAEGFEQEGAAMREKEDADARALRRAREAREQDLSTTKDDSSSAKAQSIELRLPWVVDGAPDLALRATILKLSESVQSFLEPLGDAREAPAAADVDVNRKLLEIDPALAAQRQKLVRRRTTASTVTEGEFWRRYWFHIGVARESHQLRQSLSQLANKRSGGGSRAGGAGGAAAAAAAAEGVSAKLDVDLDSDPEDDIVEFVSASQSRPQTQPLGRGGAEGAVARPTWERGGGGDGNGDEDESGDDLDHSSDTAVTDVKAVDEAAEGGSEAVAMSAPAEKVVAVAAAEAAEAAAVRVPSDAADDDDLLGEFDDLGDEFDDSKLADGDDGFDDLGDLEDLGAEVEDLLAADDF